MSISGASCAISFTLANDIFIMMDVKKVNKIWSMQLDNEFKSFRHTDKIHYFIILAFNNNINGNCT